MVKSGTLSQLVQLKRNLKIIMIAWTFIVASSLIWNLRQQTHTNNTQLKAQVEAIHAINMEYRNWIIHNGGVYVPVTDRTPPNQWLSHIPDRDIKTPSGKHLTLLNSSYVFRLIQENMAANGAAVKLHIASLKPMNPLNKADAWEADALESFAKGVKEKATVDVAQDGKSYFRFMRPMITDGYCMKCHARYGDKIGNVRGGVSISLPIDNVIAAANAERNSLLLGHSLIWGLGLLGLFIGGRHQKQSILEIEQSEAQVTLLTNSIAHAIYGIDLDGKCTFANDACIEMLGFNHQSELLGEEMHGLMRHSHKDGSMCLKEECAILRALHDGKSVHVEHEMFGRKNGTYFPATYWAYPVTLEGEIKGGVVTFIDITEQLLINWEQDIATDKLNCSDEVYRIYEVNQHDFPGTQDALLELIHPEDISTVKTAYADSLNDHSPHQVEYRIVMSDGRIKHVLQKYEVVYDSENKPITLKGITQDVTTLKQAQQTLLEHQKVLEQSLEGTIHTVSMAVELRDPYTGGHQRRVADLACSIATRMGLDENRIHGVRLGAMIHDIGKIGIPAEILSKPSKLTSVEMQLIREHAAMGYNILKDIKFPWPIAEIAHQHHERIDGSGYPNRLRGDAILLEARIVAVADVVESIASHRPYRPTLGLQAAIDEIRNNRGTLYDSRAVDACLEVLASGFEFT
jgi:PAS domain S-box-containing protein/putative nucleotidyltransferase with HDIG domain